MSVRTTTRLRLGVEPVDALGRPGPLGTVAVQHEHVPRPAGADLPAAGRNPSGRFRIAFGDRATDDPARVVVRLVDPTRRFVPRRLSIPAPSLSDVDADERAPRACRPALYPGAAYGVGAGATVVRGTVRWADGRPVQWARAAARTATPIEVHDDDGTVSFIQPVLGRAHGDDRGEFLLVIGPLPTDEAVATSSTVAVELHVAARPEPAAGDPVDSPFGSRDDPLWHLPVEVVDSLDPGDDVAAGTVLPAGSTAGVLVQLTCRRGAVTRTLASLT